MKYVISYLAIGLVMMIVVLVPHLLRPKMSTELLDSIHPERLTRRYRLLHNIIFPVLTGALITLVWPVVPVVKLLQLRK